MKLCVFCQDQGKGHSEGSRMLAGFSAEVSFSGSGWLARSIILDLGWAPVLSRVVGARLLKVDLCVMPQVGGGGSKQGRKVGSSGLVFSVCEREALSSAPVRGRLRSGFCSFLRIPGRNGARDRRSRQG